MANRTVKAVLIAEYNQFVAGMAAAGSSVKTLGAEIDKATATEKGRQNLDKLTTGATIFGAALVGVAAAAVKLSSDFDAAMSQVKANIDDKSTASMKALSNAAIQAGKDTQFSAIQAADAEDELAKAGIGAKDILGGALTGALSLAAAGQLNVGDAAEIAASAMNDFSLTGKDIPHIADLLAAGADKAQGSVSDLGNALKYIGPVAGNMGVSIESVVGVLTEFASRGIQGEQAGTSLRGILSSLTSPSAQATAELQHLGIQLYDSTGKFGGLANVAGQLHDKMKGLTDQQRDAALGVIFGNEQISAARILYQDGAAGVDKFTKAVDDQGFAAQTAHTKMDNLNGDLTKLKSSIETDLIQAGSGANSALRGMAQGATGAVNAFGGLPKPLQESLVWIAGITGALTLAGVGFVKARSGIASFQDELSKLGPTGEKAASGVGKVTSAVGKIGGIATVAIVGFELLSAGANALADAFNKPLPSVNALARSLGQLTNAQVVSGDAAKVLGPNFEQLRSDIDKIGPAASGADSALASADNTITSLLDHIGVHSLSAASMFGASWLAVLGPTDAAKNRLNDLDKALTSLVTSGHADAAQQILLNMANGAGVGIDELTAKFPKLTAALNTASAQASDSVGPMSQLVTSFDGNALSAQAAADAVQNFDDALHAINDPLIGEFAATTQFQQSLAALKQSLDQNGSSMDATTQKGQANRDAIAQVVQAALSLTDAETKLKPGTDAATNSIQASRNALIATLTPYFNSKAAAEAFVDTVLKIPPSKATQISAPGAKTSADAVWNLNNAINALHDKNVSVTEYLKTVYSSSGAPAGAAQGTQKGGLGDLLGNRWGGVHMHAAATGLLREAAIGGGGPLYQWAEPQTGGEGFVPRFGDEARSRSIIEIEAAWYGGRAMWDTSMPLAAMPTGTGGGGVSAGSLVSAVSQQLQPVLSALTAAVHAGRNISIQVDGREIMRATDEARRVETYVG